MFSQQSHGGYVKHGGRKSAGQLIAVFPPAQWYDKLIRQQLSTLFAGWKILNYKRPLKLRRKEATCIEIVYGRYHESGTRNVNVMDAT